MTLNDSLAMALSAMLNADKAHKKIVELRPTSAMLTKILTMLHEQGYIGEFTANEDGRGGHVVVNLLGRLNKCGVIKPRFSVKVPEFGKWEKRYLPAKDFGALVVSTPKGVLTHKQAKEHHVGGSLIAYYY